MNFCVRHAWDITQHGPCPQCMTSEQRLAYVWEQVRLAKLAVEFGSNPKDIQCPYCLCGVPAGATPCCDTLGRAIAAILEREDVMQCVMEQVAN
jgi:hypothetical protein